jgi:hypothetical protein
MLACHCLAHKVNGRSKTADICELQAQRKGGTPLPPPRATEPTPLTRSERFSTTLFITNKENVLLFLVVHGWTLLFSAKGDALHSLVV